MAAEGINGTVGGTNVATDIYIDAMLSHPVFEMDKEDFKVRDDGGVIPPSSCPLFSKIYLEIISMSDI